MTVMLKEPVELIGAPGPCHYLSLWVNWGICDAPHFSLSCSLFTLYILLSNDPLACSKHTV